MKSEQKLFSIGEIARALGVTRRIILHYEERGLVQPDVRNGTAGNRYYSIDTFTKLCSIRNMQKLGLTLDEIRAYLNGSLDLMAMIRRLENIRDQLNLNIDRLYERARVPSMQIRRLHLPPQPVYRRIYHSLSVAERTALLRNTALEAMLTYGTDITQRMYFIEYAIARPAEVSFCAVVPAGSRGEFVEELPAADALCTCHHGAYEDLPAAEQQLLDYASAHELTPVGTLRHIYLEGPPQHQSSDRFITQLVLPLRGPEGSR